MAKNTKADLDALHAQVHEGLFRNLASAFPEFGWERDRGRDGWVATKREHTKTAAGARPDRVICHKPQGFYVYGGEQVPWMAYVNSGAYPKGSRYFEVLKELGALAGVDVSVLDRPLDEQAQRAQAERAARRGLVATVAGLAEEALHSDRGQAAREYLRGRGFTDEDLVALGFGLYPQVEELERRLGAEQAGAAKELGLVFWKMEGYIVGPWSDVSGEPVTLFGRWPGQPVDPEVPKTMSLPGTGTRNVPLYLDRALRAGHRDLVVAVEGVLDAALLQVRGDRRVVATGGAVIPGEQVKTLVRERVRQVVLVLDPDEAGEQGTARSVEALERAGVSVFVAPPLPRGQDPDEFVQERGLQAWMDLVAGARPGAVYRAERALEGISASSSDLERRAAVEQVLAIHDSTRGPSAGLDRIDLLNLLEDRTGYPLEALAEQAESLKDRRLREELERETKRVLREGLAALEKDGAGVAMERTAADLAVLRSRTVEAPQPFDVDRLEQETRTEPEGRSLGWRSVDRLEVAFRPGELAIVAGRTGHAKTTTMVNLVANLLRQADEVDSEQVFVFYSAEEPERRIFHRLLALVACSEVGDSWSANAFRDCLQEKAGRDIPGQKTLEQAREILSRWGRRLVVVHRPAWTVSEIEADARRVALERKVGAVFGDYLQRIPAPRDLGKGRRRDEEVSATARRFKILAEDLAAPVVLGAQINRSAIKDAGSDGNIPDLPYGHRDVMGAIRRRRPQLHHLREGGSEQEADLVLGLLNYAADYGDDAENPTLPPVTRLEIGCLKNRYGPVGKWAKLAFEGRYGWLRDPVTGEAQNL